MGWCGSHRRLQHGAVRPTRWGNRLYGVKGTLALWLELWLLREKIAPFCHVAGRTDVGVSVFRAPRRMLNIPLVLSLGWLPGVAVFVEVAAARRALGVGVGVALGRYVGVLAPAR